MKVRHSKRDRVVKIHREQERHGFVKATQIATERWRCEGETKTE